ncbi:hypothetical protein M3A88_11760 [Kocuria marina]|uniref:hypothetical protein n=1 Tax=Kocuria marina TaxID=223184 RepID=UPI002989BCB8|nr:hypothetical protein [Kocuria marina]MCT1735906.1 hypothetical protein [Kocuria marina]
MRTLNVDFSLSRPVLALTSAANKAARITVWVVLAVLLLTAANWISELVIPQPAGAFDITKICDPSFQMPEPQSSTVTYNGEVKLSGPKELWVTPNDGSYTGSGTLGAAYGTGGFTWHTYGTSLCQPLDYTTNITTLVAGFVLSWLVSMASMMGTMLQAAFTTPVATTLLENAELSNVLKAINDDIWGGWYSLLIGGALIFIGYMVLRSQTQRAFSSLLWVIAASGLIAISASTTYLSTLAVGVNNATNNLSNTALFAIAGSGDACDTVSAETPSDLAAQCMTANMANIMVMPVWTTGMVGGLGNAEAPVILNDKNEQGTAQPDLWVNWNTEGDSVGKDVKFAAVQLPPKDVVPTVNDSGNPSAAEYLRWTQTYTAAEEKAIRDKPEMRCLRSQTPTLEELDKMARDKGGDSSKELCVQKWAVRAGILYGMKATNPTAYAAAAGKDDLNARITPGVIAMPFSMATEFIIIVAGVLMLFYQLEMVFYFFFTIVFLMASVVKGPRVMLDWVGWVGATAIKRVGLGLMLGFTLLAFTWVQSLFSDISLSGAGPLLLIFIGIIQHVILISSMIAVLIMWFKLRKTLLRSTGTERYGTSAPIQALQNAGRKALAIGGATATGALTGGVAGAATAAATTTLSKDTNIISGLRRGVSTGTNMRANKEANTAAKEQVGVAYRGMELSSQEAEGHEKDMALHTQAAETATSEAEALQGEAATAEAEAKSYENAANKEFTSFVATSTPEGRRASDDLNLAGMQANESQREMDQIKDARVEFAAKHDLHHLHELDDDGNLRITDVATGKVETTADTSQYDPRLDVKNALADPQVRDEYTVMQLDESLARDANDSAQMNLAVAQSDMDQLVEKHKAAVSRMSNAEIREKYDDPDTANRLIEWKSREFQAQKLQQRTTELQQKANERLAAASESTKEAQRSRGYYNAALGKVSEEQQRAIRAEERVKSTDPARASMSSFTHGLRGKSTGPRH